MGCAVEFLSQQWGDALLAACSSAPPVLQDCTIEVQITGAPRGRGRVSIVIAGGVVSSYAPVKSNDANLQLKTTWDDARGFALGTANPQVSYMTGDLKTDGPTGPLLALLGAWGSASFGEGRQSLADATSDLVD